jgi:cleavage stimulation factor subunit 3
MILTAPANSSQAEQWVEYIRMESELEELKRVELLFQRCIGTTPHVGLWQQYINHVRRVNNVSTDPNARTTITQVYEFVTEIIGIDVSSGSIWVDYIEFVKSGPGVVGGQGWQDMQKMDNLRKVYQRAIAVPTNATLDIWREYDRFEMGLNKVAVSIISVRRAVSKADFFLGPQEPSREVAFLHDCTKCQQRARECH